ncbi:hypothetical protein D9R08_06355 [Rhodophyticola porphyridii]|uniref:Uncharacterized protein n=1 Tax=Rhodophyticola porphyridii TaxID=1852017 RepID=A0A3L9YB94_9RHOB|nr:hypothetical protein D9R08_06355 [Rhodophyticola porphyridii]
MQIEVVHGTAIWPWIDFRSMATRSAWDIFSFDPGDIADIRLSQGQSMFYDSSLDDSFGPIRASLFLECRGGENCISQSFELRAMEGDGPVIQEYEVEISETYLWVTFPEEDRELFQMVILEWLQSR